MPSQLPTNHRTRCLLLLAVGLTAFPADAQRVETQPAQPQTQPAGAGAVALRGHTNSLTNAMFSPDGRRVAAGASGRDRDRGQTAHLWDAATGKEIAVLQHDGDGYDAHVLMFSADSTRVITWGGSLEKVARVWNADDGKRIAELRGYDFEGRYVAFSPDGRRVITTTGPTRVTRLSENSTSYHTESDVPRVRDVDTGKEIAVLQTDETHYYPTFSRDGKRVLTVDFDDNAHLWNAETGEKLAVLLPGHREWEPFVAAFSPDGKRIVTVTDGDAVRVWEADSGKQLHTLKLGADNLHATAAVFSPDSTRVLTTSDDFIVRLWDVATGKEIAVMDHLMGPVEQAAFSADGQRILTLANNIARVWEADTGKKLAVFSGDKDTGELVAFTADWKRAITCSENWPAHPVTYRSQVPRTARILDLVFTGPETDPDDLEEARLDKNSTALRGHRRPIHSAEFSLDGKRVLTHSWDDTIRVWNADTGKELLVARDEQTVRNGESELREDVGVAFGRDGELLITKRDEDGKFIRVRNIDMDKELAVLQAPNVAVSDVTFSPDGTRALAKANDLTAHIWDIASGKELVVLGLPPDPLDRSNLPNHHKIVFNTDDGKAPTQPDEESEKDEASAKDEEGAKSEEGEDEGLEDIEIPGDSFDSRERPRWGTFYSAEFSPTDEHVVAICSLGLASRSTAHGSFVILYSVETGEPIPLRRGEHSKTSNRRGESHVQASFSPDGKRLVTTGHGDGITRVWSTEDGSEVLALDGHESGANFAAFTPDGKHIVTAGRWNDDIRIWNADTGEEIHVLRVPGKPERPPHIRQTTLSPDGKQVIAFSHDNTLRIWTIDDGKEQAVLRIPASQDGIPVLSPDGKRVVTFSTWGKTARVWNADAITETPTAAALVDAIKDWVLLLEADNLAEASQRWCNNEDAAQQMEKFWPNLKNCHQQFDYRTWTDQAGKVGNSTTFTVGGHDAGHMHTVWSLTAAGWRIGEVFICR